MNVMIRIRKEHSVSVLAFSRILMISLPVAELKYQLLGKSTQQGHHHQLPPILSPSLIPPLQKVFEPHGEREILRCIATPCHVAFGNPISDLDTCDSVDAKNGLTCQDGMTSDFLRLSNNRKCPHSSHAQI